MDVLREQAQRVRFNTMDVLYAAAPLCGRQE